MMTRRLLLTLIVAVSFNVYAKVDDPQLRPQVASLISSPARCVLKAGMTHCQMMVNLMWEVPEVNDYCLWHEGGKKPIKCWQQAWQGRVKIRFSASKKAKFMLKSDNQVLSQAIISVTGNYKQRKRAQRRKRGFWRMF